MAVVKYVSMCSPSRHFTQSVLSRLLYNSVTLRRFCFFSVFTDAEERASDAEDSAQDKDDTDEDATLVVWKRDELVRGESDDDSDASEPEEPEVELQPWFVPEGYKVNV
jgi:hypothetical protein